MNVILTLSHLCIGRVTLLALRLKPLGCKTANQTLLANQTTPLGLGNRDPCPERHLTVAEPLTDSTRNTASGRQFSSRRT